MHSGTVVVPSGVCRVTLSLSEGHAGFSPVPSEVKPIRSPNCRLSNKNIVRLLQLMLLFTTHRK